MFSWRKAILKSQLAPTTRHVLLTLACHMNAAGESCYPSIKLLCEETGLSNRSVITHLQIAKEEGWITVGVHGFAGQRWAAHEYYPAWPHYLREAANSMKKAMNEVHRVKEKAVKEVHDPSKEGGERHSEGGERHSDKAVKEVHSSNPESNPESNPVSLPKATVSDLQSEKNKRSTYFPKDFEVTEEMFDWAVSLGIKPESVKPNTLHFKDHHEANGNKFTNWNAAWRNWMRNSVKFARTV